jgi:peptide/nickel transport system substrate-binding protein
VTLNPRQTLDAMGQRLGALIFGALTRMDAELVPQPDLATRWSVAADGLSWRFELPPGLADHAGGPIGPAELRECLEEYRAGKPPVAFLSAFSTWKATEADAAGVTLRLSAPDPYLARNLSLLRFFRVPGGARACQEPPPGSPMIASGRFSPSTWEPERELTLAPRAAADAPLRFVFMPEDAGKLVALLRGDVDGTLSSLSLTKTRWLRERAGGRFTLLDREGVNVTYLGYNLRDPLLRDPRVRRAIALAIDRERIVRHKFFGFATPAGTLLSPRLPEAAPQPFAYDPAEAERLLDQAGYPRGPRGTRLSLRFKSTQIRENLETALILQAMLERVGIAVTVDVVDGAALLASLRKGGFQIFASRYSGISDGSILMRTLRSDSPQNRFGYADAEVDAWLDAAAREPAESQRARLLARVQERAARDLPFLPLWYWSNTLILREGVGGLRAQELSLSGALDPLTRLRRTGFP